MEISTKRELLTALDGLRTRAARGTGRPKVSLRELQARTGVPRSSLSGYLTGATPMPVDVLDAIVLALGVSPAETRRWAQAWEQVMAVPAAGPRHLPAPPSDFTGRGRELAELDGRSRGVVLITGSAGVGKSTLAVHWAHRVADRFPDGQLHANLRGFDPGGEPADPSDVLRGFLEALGVPAPQQPFTLEARTGVFRELLAGRHVLVVLDNARDADQVRPLLPGTGGSLALVTTRRRLTALIVTEGAYPLVLDVLPADEAQLLLSAKLGAARIAADPGAAGRIVARCAGLPLALAVVAARAALRPGLSMAELDHSLDTGPSTLAAFADTDPAVDLRAVFTQSYADLDAAAARLFQLAGAHAGEEFTLAAAASLCALTADQTWPLLAHLAQAHLVGEPVPHRYTMHDLLRAYAREVAGGGSGEALHRLVDHYVQSAHLVNRLVTPQRSEIVADPLRDGTTVAPLADADQARQWYARERDTILRLVATAAERGLLRECWHLAWAVADLLLQQGHWQQQLTAQATALSAARQLGDVDAQARSQAILARTNARMGRYDAAAEHFHQALDVFVTTGDLTAQAHTHLGLHWVFSQFPAGYQRTSAHARQALELFRRTGDTRGQARALNSLGWSHTLNGEYELTVQACEQARDLLAELGWAEGEAHAWDSLGLAHLHLSDPVRAVDCYRQAITLFRQAHQRGGEADTLQRLGDALLAQGDVVGAHESWNRALAIMDEFGDPKADAVRAKLSLASGNVR
ncbi:tetratricopeptide repeat protein [Catellatospora vulcania]|uniref:tetratricopeptide repeat protein n=1 Tax=Catellatospora vulcania TaxID=1460450 RepID=UPI0018AFB956|nr:tetratricopeptide repeat protein [Catellatospora vulcania]